LDTNFVSVLRVRGRHQPVEVRAASVPVGDQFVSAFTISEIERGVIAKQRSDARQGAVLRRWFDENSLRRFADRVLPFDLSAARILAAYRVPEHARLDDALIEG
jgi:predicted nucleic acid-binding protein